MENWKWGIDSAEKIKQHIAKKIEELWRICCEETDRARQARIDVLCMHQKRNPTTVSQQLLTQIQDLQNKVNSLPDAREFYDPETASSSGATHVPSKPATSESQDHALPRFWIAAWYTEYCWYFRKRFWTTSRPRRTNLYYLWRIKEFGILSQELRPDTAGNTKRPEIDKRRETQNSSILVPRFQSGGGLLNHTGGTYSHGGFYWLSEIPYFGIASGYVRKKSADPHLTMHWIQEVEIAKSIDELMTSRSIVVRNDFPDYDMLDAMIASALKRLLNKHIHFRNKASVEEQRPQKYDRFLRGRQNCSQIYEHFRAIGAYGAVRGLPVLFSIRLQNDDVQDSDVRWDQALLPASDMPSDVILKGLYKSKLQDSVQLQTVLALYDQETVRNNGQTSFLRLKTSVKLHIGQMMRTRSFRVRNEGVERGSVTKGQKGKKACVGGKVEECFQRRAHGQCSKGESCRFSHDRQAQGDMCIGQRRKGRSSSPAPNSKAKTEEREENHPKHQATGRKAQQTKGAQIRAVTKIVKTRHVDFGILPCV